MQETAELIKTTFYKYAFSFVHHFHHSTQLGTTLRNVLHLRLGDLGCTARKSRKEKEEAVLEISHALVRKIEWCHGYTFVGKPDSIEATEGGRDPVLRTNVFADALLFDMDGALGELLFCNLLSI